MAQLLVGKEETGLTRDEMDQVMGPVRADLLQDQPTSNLVMVVEVFPPHEPTLKVISLDVAVTTDCLADAIKQLLDRELIYCSPGMSSTLTMSFTQQATLILGNVQVSVYHEITEAGVKKNNIDVINREAQDGFTSLAPGKYDVAYIQSVPMLGVDAELKAARTDSRTVTWPIGE